MAQQLNNENQNCSELEMEIQQEELALKEMQKKMVQSLEEVAKVAPPTPEEQKAIDSVSVFVGNVDFNSTIEEIEEHFKGCGEIIRTTIPKDKFTKKQKNIAFIQFDSSASVENALVMDGSMFRGRQIVVTAKRTNVPGMGFGGGSRGRGGRGMGNRGRGRGGPAVVVKYVYVNGPGPARGRGGFRGRHFAPY